MSTQQLNGKRIAILVANGLGAMLKMRCEVRLGIIRGATHLFEERGALEQVARLASDWFRDHLRPQDKVVIDGLNPT